MADWGNQSEQRASPKTRSRPHSRATSEFRSRSPGTSRKKNTSSIQWLADISFYLTLVIVLLAFAGRTPIGQFCLCVGTVITMTLWLAAHLMQREEWKWTGLEPVFLLAIGLIALQLTPLSDQLLEQLAPRSIYFEGADLSEPPMPPGHLEWNLLSYNPQQSRLSFSSILSVMLLFLMLVQRMQHREYARRFIVALGLGTACFAGFGILQYLYTNDRFFWLIQHPFANTSTGAKGSFTNANHFAGFLSMAIGPILAWTISRPAPKRKSSLEGWKKSSKIGEELRPIIGGLALIVILLGIVLSASRGGMLLAMVSISITITLVMLKRLADARLPLLLSVMALAALGGISLWGQEYFENNINNLATGDIDQIDAEEGRRFIWQANLEAQSQFRWLGLGLGTHRDVMPAFQSRDLNRLVYTHAENSYLQIGSELGVAGWILLGAAVLLVIIRQFHQLSNQNARQADLPLLAGIAGTVGVFLVHGTYDFGWYAPAYMLMLAAYVAFLFGRSESGSVTVPQINLSALLLMVGLLGGVVWLSPYSLRAASTELPEMRYLVLTQARRTLTSPDEELLSLRLRIQELETALRHDPENGRFHLWKSNCLRRVFELKSLHSDQAMPMAQIRAAAYSGGFNDAQKFVNWLKMPAVMGETYPLGDLCLEEARLALKYCPFLTTAWLTQADLCFLESPDASQPDYFLERARRTNPHAGEILFTRGYHAWNDGDVETALHCWQQIFSSDKEVRRYILELTTGALGPDEVVKLFDPGYAEMVEIAQAYFRTNHPERGLAAVRLAEITLTQGPEMSSADHEKALLIAFNSLTASQQVEAGLQFIDQAVRQQGDSPELRKAFGTWLAEQKQYALALTQLETYMQYMSHDPEILRLIHHCRKQQHLTVQPAGFSVPAPAIR